MRIDQPAKIVRLERQVPALEGNQHERGLPFDNGRYIVFAHELNGRGRPTGKMLRMASFAAPNLANLCRDRINAQNPVFQAQVEVDQRIAEGDPVMEMFRRKWPGQRGIQNGPYYVSTTYIDALGRYIGGGAVSWFEDEASAKACADILNTENPAHEAKVEKDEEYAS